MATPDNMVVQQRLGEIINSGKFEDLTEVFAADVLDHDPAPDQGPGSKGFVDFFTQLKAAFPDLSVTPEEIVAGDNDLMAQAYTIKGTHQGDFMGVPATGKAVTARGMQIAKFRDGKIVERWGSSDELGILQQIGAAPAG